MFFVLVALPSQLSISTVRLESLETQDTTRNTFLAAKRSVSCEASDMDWMYSAVVSHLSESDH